jgi:hypothetical protein
MIYGTVLFKAVEQILRWPVVYFFAVSTDKDLMREA